MISQRSGVCDRFEDELIFLGTLRSHRESETKREVTVFQNVFRPFTFFSLLSFSPSTSPPPVRHPPLPVDLDLHLQGSQQADIPKDTRILQFIPIPLCTEIYSSKTRTSHATLHFVTHTVIITAKPRPFSVTDLLLSSKSNTTPQEQTSTPCTSPTTRRHHSRRGQDPNQQTPGPRSLDCRIKTNNQEQSQQQQSTLVQPSPTTKPLPLTEWKLPDQPCSPLQQPSSTKRLLPPSHPSMDTDPPPACTTQPWNPTCRLSPSLHRTLQQLPSATVTRIPVYSSQN